MGRSSDWLRITVVFLSLAGTLASAQGLETDAIKNAERLYSSGKWSEAEKSFAGIVRDHPDNIAAQMYLGQTLFKEEKFAAAIVPYEKVRALEKAGAKLTLTQHRILGDQLAMAAWDTRLCAIVPDDREAQTWRRSGEPGLPAYGL